MKRRRDAGLRQLARHDGFDERAGIGANPFESIFHAVGDLHRGIQLDDPGGTLDGMGRAHERFENLVVRGIVLQRKQPVGQHGLVVFDLDLEKFEHRKGTEIIWLLFVHCRLMLIARKSCT